MKNCSLWEGLTLEKFKQSCLLWEGPYAGAGEECEEEGSAETTCDEMSTTTIFHHAVPLRGTEVEKIGSEAEPRKKGGVG